MTSVKDHVARFNQTSVSSSSGTSSGTSPAIPAGAGNGSSSAAANQKTVSTRVTTTVVSSRTERYSSTVHSSASIGSNVNALLNSFDSIKLPTKSSAGEASEPAKLSGRSTASIKYNSSRTSSSLDGLEDPTAIVTPTTGVVAMAKTFEVSKASAGVGKDVSSISTKQSSPVSSKVSQLPKSHGSTAVPSNSHAGAPSQSSSISSKIGFFSKALDNAKVTNEATNRLSKGLTQSSPVNSEVSRLSKSFESVKVASGTSVHSTISMGLSSVEEKVTRTSQTHEHSILPISTVDSGKVASLVQTSTNSISGGKVNHLSKNFGSAKVSFATVNEKTEIQNSTSKLGLNVQSIQKGVKTSMADQFQKQQQNDAKVLLSEDMASVSTRKRTPSSTVKKLSAAEEVKPSSVQTLASNESLPKKLVLPETPVNQSQLRQGPRLEKLSQGPVAKESGIGALLCSGQSRLSLAGKRADEFRSLVDIQAIDAIATAKTPSDARKSVGALVTYLTGLVQRLACLTKANDSLRQFANLRVLQRWIGHNIVYDTHSLYRGTITAQKCEPDTVLKTGLAVCSGYSRLFCEMAKIVGLEMRCVSGISKGAGYTVGDVMSADKTDHEWNIVVLDGDTYHLDATWSAGTCNGLEFTREWDEHYFLTPAEMFVLDHFPQDRKDQYINPPISLEEFVNLPHIKSHFFRAKMVPGSSSSSKGVIDCDGQAEVELRFNIAESWTFHQPELRPKRKGGLSKKLPDTVNVFWISKNQIKVICRVPSENGEYVLRLFTCPQSNDESGSWAADYLLRVNRPPLQKPDLFPYLYSTHHLKVLEPMNVNLSVGTKVRFRHQFIASDMQQDHRIVVILPGNDWVYLKSKREGDGSILFEDEILMKKAGEVKISIQHSGEKSAHTVAKYKAA